MSYVLGDHFDAFVQAQLASGRYHDASDVLRDALRLMEQQQERPADLDAALARGIEAADAGRVRDLDEVCDEIDAMLAALPDHAAP
jgi:antitoxin ParD1/3/4